MGERERERERGERERAREREKAREESERERDRDRERFVSDVLKRQNESHKRVLLLFTLFSVGLQGAIERPKAKHWSVKRYIFLNTM